MWSRFSPTALALTAGMHIYTYISETECDQRSHILTRLTATGTLRKYMEQNSPGPISELEASCDDFSS